MAESKELPGWPKKALGIRSMPILLRRMLEDFDAGYSLATAILSTLGFGELDCVEIVHQELSDIV
jgi:hypothetical protein